MTCKYCGSELKEGTAFCGKCGNAVEEIEMVNQDDNIVNESESIGKGKMRIVLPIILITSIIAIIVAIVCVIIAQTNLFSPEENNLEAGYTYLNDGNYGNAVTAFNKVLDSDKDNVKALLGLAEAYESLDKIDKAKECLEKALTFDAGNQKAQEKLMALSGKNSENSEYSIENTDGDDTKENPTVNESGIIDNINTNDSNENTVNPMENSYNAILSQIEELEKKEKIIIGTNAAFPPFEFFDDNGEIVGFDIDLIKMICEELGYEIEIRNMEFDQLLIGLYQKQIDVAIAGMNATEERRKYCDFSIPYLEAKFTSGNGEVFDDCYAIATQNGDPIVDEINACVTEYKQNGTIDALVKKWHLNTYGYSNIK